MIFNKRKSRKISNNNNENQRKITLFLSTIIIFSFITTYNISAFKENTTRELLPKKSQINANSNQISHDPIRIENNSDFLMFCSEGDGTLKNPYIIEDYLIKAENNDGIFIQNTDAYAIIQKCTIKDGRTSNNNGITLNKCQNIQIQNCLIVNNSIGINIEYLSTLISIFQNNITSNTQYGIKCVSSIYINIQHNYISRNWQDGIFLLIYSSEMEESGNYTIFYNTCIQNRGAGIYLTGIENSTINMNTCVFNEASGIYIRSGIKNILQWNNCSFNTNGMSLLVDNSIINQNWCQENLLNGISLRDSDDNYIYNNTLMNNQFYGLMLESSSNNIITENFFKNNLEGMIKLEGNCESNEFSKNNPLFLTTTKKISIIGSILLITLFLSTFFLLKSKKRKNKTL